MKNKAMDQLMQYAGGYKVLAYLSQVLSAISALVALLPFYWIWRILKEVLAVAPNYEQATGLAKYGWLAVAFAAISMLLYIAGLWCSHLAAFRVQANMRTRLVHHIVTLPMGFMDGVGSGKMRKTITDCAAATETYLAHQLPDRAGAMVTPLGLLVLLLVFDWRLGLLSLVPVVIAFLVMSAMTGKRMETKMREYQNALEDMSNEAVEYVRGIPVVKTFGQSVFSFKRFKNSIDNYEKWVIAYTKDMRMPMVLYTVCINAVFAVLVAVALVLTRYGVTGEFLLNLLFYIIVTPIITVTLNKIMYSSENKMLVEDALNRVNGILDMQPQTQPAAPKAPRDGSVDLANVEFAYNADSANALDGVSMQIPAGAHIALVGPSGSGKSTLGGIVARFWDPQKGVVKIGGVPVQEISKEVLMNTVSFVFQDAKLLKTSVFENVRMAKPDATREEVAAALHNAMCDDILEKLPQDMDTVIGSDGVYLSGGETQRIAIARVMLKNTPILILDEATAFADPDNEVQVQKAFSALSKGKTVIMIAHRLSTVVDADCIYVLKDGKIAESGTHQALQKAGGLYSEMWQEYTKAADWKVGANK